MPGHLSLTWHARWVAHALAELENADYEMVCVDVTLCSCCTSQQREVIRACPWISNIHGIAVALPASR